MPPALPRRISLALALTGALLAGVLVGVLAGPDLRRLFVSLSAPEPDDLVLSPARYMDLPGWQDDTLQGFVGTLNRSCRLFLTQKPDKPVGPNGRFGRAADWAEVCKQAASWPESLSGAPLRAALEQAFTPMAVRNGHSDQGKFTGYYEPELRGSLQRQGPYQVALLRNSGS